jgi:orotidine-5'-phosphate decarboxylase
MAEAILALDVPSARDALRLIDELGPSADFYKVGLELYTRAGPAMVEELRAREKRVFLDLKLHDIPNTVAGAVEAAVELGVDLLTVHAAGGVAMLEAAHASAGGRMRVVAVTVLTSLGAGDLSSAWGRAVSAVPDEALRLASLARSAGLDGAVASASDAGLLRRVLGPGFLVVVPGIRLPGSPPDDQQRSATPAEAVRAGADYLVLGRAVTRAADPVAALEAVRSEIARASSPEP